MARIALVALAYDPVLDPFAAADAYQIASSASRKAAVNAAIREAADNKAAGVFFSGYTAAINRLAQVASSPIVTLLRSNNLAGVFELMEPGIAGTGGMRKGKGKGAGFDSEDPLARRAFFVVPSKAGGPTGPFRQCVVQSSDATKERLQTLAGELKKGASRRHRVAGQEMALLICGESNILHTARDRERTTGERYPTQPGWFDYDLLFNPQHSVWKRFEIDERLKFFSKHGTSQLAASCANYPEGSEHLQRIICVAQGGNALTLPDHTKSNGNGYIMRLLDL